MTFHLRSVKYQALKLAQIRKTHCASLLVPAVKPDSNLDDCISYEKIGLVKLLNELSERFEDIKSQQNILHQTRKETSFQYFAENEKNKKQCKRIKRSPHTSYDILPSQECMIVKPYLLTSDDILLHMSAKSDIWNTNSLYIGNTSWQSNTAGCSDMNSDVISSESYHVTIIQQPSCNNSYTLTSEIVKSPNIDYFQTGISHTKDETSSVDKNMDPLKKPNADQIQLIHDHLAEYIPNFFVKKHDYRIYSKDVILENRLGSKPVVYQGLSQYAYRISLLRMSAVMKYANVRMGVLKITWHEEDGTVRVRWRISGVPQLRAFMFWKFLPWNYKKALNNESEWFDGFSIFYVDGTGRVCKHVMDKVIPDDEREVDKKGNLAVKLALLLGLAPKSDLGDAMSWLFKGWGTHKQLQS